MERGGDRVFDRVGVGADHWFDVSTRRLKFALFVVPIVDPGLLPTVRAMTEKRRRILLITRNLPPLVGGMERLNWNLAAQLAKGAEVRIIGPQGAAALAPSGVSVCEVPITPLWKFLLIAMWRACREAHLWRPDLVLAGSGLAAPLAYLAAGISGARTAVYVHGLDIAVKHPMYRALWLPAIRRMDRVIANSTATAGLCRSVGVDPASISVVHPGVELPPHEDADGSVQAAARFRQQHQVGERPLLLSVGRLSVRKGLREFVREAFPRIIASRPEVLLIIIGDAPNDALHARAQTPASIRAAAIAAGVADHLRFLGTITDYEQLGIAYRAAAVHVFPVREILGDPEGFGMVAVEAAAHGLPTVAFATGGVVDAVAEGRSGRLVPPGDYEEFAAAVLNTLDTAGGLRESCLEFAQSFAWPVFGQRVIDEITVAD